MDDVHVRAFISAIIIGSTVVPVSAIERQDHDLHYIEGWSLWLDARIVLRTLVREFILGSAD